jgi:agmatine/peptidylarginine deiminase
MSTIQTIRAWVKFVGFLQAVLFFLLTSSLHAQNYAVRFFGNGVGDIDRIKIPINNPEKNADIGFDFTIEFQMNALLSDNPLGAGAVQGNNDDWVLGHVIVDRDIFGPGDYGDYGISLTNGRIAFGVNNGANSFTLIGSTMVADGNWYHIAVTRNQSDGELQIFVNGVLDNAVISYVTGNVSYRNNRTTIWPNDPYIILGAEKHDYDNTTYPSYSGYLDELRISNIVRYNGSYSPVETFTDDEFTVALYHFNEGSGTAVFDAAAISGNNSDGYLSIGGSPAGPIWVLREGTPAETYTITVIIDPAIGGSVTGAGVYEEGENVTLLADPSVNYEFVRWSENNTEVSTLSELIFTAMHDRTITAEFVFAGSGIPLNSWSPPEYFPSKAVIIEWDFYEGTWPIYSQLISECKTEAEVILLVNNQQEEDFFKSYLQNALITLDNISFVHVPSGRMWIRDHGPLAVMTDSGVAYMDFEDFASSGPSGALPTNLANLWGLDAYNLTHIILDGGNFMVDSYNNLFATNRLYTNNPGYSEAYINNLLQTYMGITNITTFDQMGSGDYWGHIDMQIKLLDDTTVVISSVQPGWPVYGILENNFELFSSLTSPSGEPYRIGRLPKAENWKSYTNALILNSKVIVPVYDHPNDQVAIAVYEELLPGHTIVGINANAIVGWDGVIHCITMQLFDEGQIQPLIPENLIVTGNVSGEEEVCYNAVNTITVQDFNLATGGEVNLIAGYQILFEPEVSIESGSYMRARITQDEDFCMQPPAIANSNSKQIPDLDKKESVSLEFHSDKLQTFPNPSNGVFTLAIPEMPNAEGLQIQIYNSQGLLVYDAFTIQASPITINISWLPAGIYFIRSLADERVMSGKIGIN